jgi:protein deglycase
MKKVLVCIANGSEELEAISIIDTLRRAEANVTVAKITSNEENDEKLEIIASRGVKIVADVFFSEIISKEFDLIVLPGGLKGAQHFSKSKELIEKLQKQKSNGKFYAAICASPAIVFSRNSLFDGISKGTCYPSMIDKLPKDLSVPKDRVVVDQHCITSQGPCTAVEFSLKLVELLFDEKTSKKVAEGMLF